MRIKKLIRINLAVSLLCLSAVTAAVGGGGVSWQKWNKQTFDRALSQNKLILLNVGVEGCAACGRMENITYSDSDVIAALNKNFIAIAIDAEARPDIGERYSDWAWPATIFLKPDATQVLAIAGNRLPSNFLPILKDLNNQHQAGKLKIDPDSPYKSPPQPVDTEISLLRDRVRTQLDNILNDKEGGWGSRSVNSEGAGFRLKHLYQRADMYQHQELRNIALKTTDVMIRGTDPVWGGAFVMTLHQTPDKNSTGMRLMGGIPEMRISSQANTMAAAAEAYHLTKDGKYRVAANNIARYLNRFMTAADGSFYSNQKLTPPGLSEDMSEMDYWLLKSDSERQKYGTPPVDHSIYTDKNGEMIVALVEAYEAFDEKSFLDAGIKAANALLDSRLQKDGWITQATANDQISGDQRYRPYDTELRPFLSAQAWFGSALLALHGATGESKWLEHAYALGKQLLHTLEDTKNGGFFATIADDTASLIAPRKSLEHNARAALFYYDLWIYTKDDRFKTVAEKTLRAVADPTIVSREGKAIGQLALALERVSTAYVEFTIVGDTVDSRSQELFNQARLIYHPRKIVHFEKPGRYPDRGKPAMYICNPDKCSLPIYDPAVVAKVADGFRGPASSIR